MSKKSKKLRTEKENSTSKQATTHDNDNTYLKTSTTESIEKESILNECGELKDKNIRLQAEFDNYRKRTQKERLELLISAQGTVLKSFLPIIDDLERAIQTFQDPKANTIDNLQKGLELVYGKFQEILKKERLTVMEVRKGSDFNSDLHEAITQVDVEEEFKGKIVEVVEKGYLLNDKVVRFAKVIVGK